MQDLLPAQSHACCRLIKGGVDSFECGIKASLRDGEEAVAARRDGVATRGILTRLFAPRRRLQSIGSPLPDVLFWKILEFWRTARDP